MAKEDVEKLLSLLDDKIWVSIERTVQIVQFEPVKISMGESRTVGPDNNPDELRMSICRKLLQDAIQEGENVRANFEQYLKKEDPTWAQPPSSHTQEGLIRKALDTEPLRRKRRI